MSENVSRGLIEALGGEQGCKEIARDFYARLETNGDLRKLFPGKSLRCATEEFAAFLIQFLGGDESQTQYRWWLSLRESHARFQITERHRAAWLSLMAETITARIKEPAAQQALRSFFAVASTYIVDEIETPLEDGELKWRWEQQQALDQLMADLANGRDREAIVLARQFANRNSVFVGILARMMQAGREPLIEFVLECIQIDNQLMQACFNGRTLLHHAAGSSVLPVVRRLLDLGVDPDTLDSGGHTPLYRVASSKCGEERAEIVAALVLAGANVDHCGGVNRSTPLHEAARHGNLRVAEALLDAGASPLVMDRKGLTPFDRARNCRRYNVSALLAARS